MWRVVGIPLKNRPELRRKSRTPSISSSSSSLHPCWTCFLFSQDIPCIVNLPPTHTLYLFDKFATDQCCKGEKQSVYQVLGERFGWLASLILLNAGRFSHINQSLDYGAYFSSISSNKSESSDFFLS